MRQRSIWSEMWQLWIERCKTKKALRILNKQEWSIEFLTAMLIRASRITGQPLEMTIVGPGSVAVQINTMDNPQSAVYRDESIFNHLDDDLKIQSFINQVSK